MSKRKQISLILLCWVLYLTSYVAKYSYTANINPIMTFYSVSKSEAGLISTLFFFAYGAGQIINGLLCKFYNKKYVISGAMIISAIVNGIIFFQPPFAYIKYFWLINGLAQSFLWSSLMVVLSDNLDDALLGKAVFAMATTVPVGTCITYGCSALFLNSGTNFYKYSFLLGSFLALIVAFLWIALYSSLTIKKSKDAISVEKTSTFNNDKKKTVDNSFVFLLVSLCIIAVIINFVKDGVNTWFPTILKEMFGLGDSLSVLLTFALPMCGVFGAVVALGFNKFLKDYIQLLGVLFVLTSILIGISLILFAQSSKAILVLIFVIVCFALLACLLSSSNNVVTTIAPLYLRRKMNSGFTSGIINGCCYLGSTLASYLFGLIAENSGWNVVFIVSLCICLMPVLYMAIYSFIKIFKKEKEKISI